MLFPICRTPRFFASKVASALTRPLCSPAGSPSTEREHAVLEGSTGPALTPLCCSCSAKVTWRDSSTHHHDHPLFFHDFNFLNPTTATPSGAKAAAHVHTLKAGRHVFPFSLHIPGHLPASLRTYSGTCVVEYKLKAVAIRAGFGADWKARKIVKISRGFGVDAVEYNQTLEIGASFGHRGGAREIGRAHV